ncbi:MAG: DUF4845 domain-containing protein [Candidatus Obscuribacterales bacterium]|nr:DUF4845 domain-containing protein [Steroidobacteraceae bacterium]
MQAGWRHRQRGATFLGVLIIGGILLVGVYAGIRLVPLYLEFFAVQRALTLVATDGDETPAAIRRSLDRRWEIEDIKSISPKEIEITKMGEGTKIRAAYRAEAPFIANVSIVVDFDKSVSMGGAKL